MTDFSLNLILKVKQYKNANIANFVYYRKTRLLRYAAIDVKNLDLLERIRNFIGGGGNLILAEID